MSLGQRVGLVAIFAIAVTIFALGIAASFGSRSEAPSVPAPAASAPTPGATAEAEEPAAGSARRPADAGPLGPQGSVAGPDGAALAGAEVFALDAALDPAAALRAAAAWTEDGEPVPGVLARGIADADGAFAPLPVDAAVQEVLLVARAPRAYSPAPVRSSRAFEVASVWRGTDLVLERGADLVLRGPAGPVTVRPDTREGVLLPSGTPLGERRARIGEDGRARLFGLPPGVPLEIELVPTGDAAPARVWAAPLFPGETREVALPDDPGGPFAGRVIASDGAPVADALVEVAHFARAGRPRPALREGRTDADGRFRIEGVPRGELVGRVKSAGAPQLDFWLPDFGEARSSGGFVLELGAGTRLAGRVVGPDGAPVAGASVRVEPERGSFAVVVDAEPRTATSAADGAFEVHGLEGRRFLVTADATGVDGTSLRGVRREAEAGVELTLELVPTAALEIVATDPDGAPVTQLAITALLDDRPSSGQVPGQVLEVELERADGRYLLEGLQPGAWTLELVPRDLAPIADLAVVLPTDGPLERAFEAAATVTGRVVDPDGNPISGGRVSAWATRPEGMSYRVRESEAALTDADGRFELRRLRPGRLHLSARHPDFARSAWRDFDLGPGQRRTGIELSVREGASIAGRVLDDAGRPLENRIVVMHAVEAWDPVRLRTDADGRFAAEHLVPGEWQLLVLGVSDEDPGAASLEEMRLAHVELVDGEHHTIEIGGAATDGGRLAARAPWVPEGASNWAYVRAPGDGAMLSQVLGDDGAFEMTTDRPGPHLVSLALDKAVERGYEAYLLLDATPFDAPVERATIEGASGRVFGRVTDGDGTPLAGVAVRLEPLAHLVPGERLATRFVMSSTASDGAFAFERVTAGRYRVTVGGLRYVEGGPPVARVAARVLGPIELADGAEHGPLEVATGAPRTVSGRVETRSGRPVPRATVYARLANGLLAHDLGLVYADDDGRFTYAGLPPGESLSFAATADGFASDEVELTDDRDLRLAGDEAGALVVEHDTELGGLLSVRDERGRELAGRTDVRSASRSGGLSWEDGETRFERLAPGRYTVELVTHDGRSAVKYVQLTAGDERRVALRVGQ